MKNNNNDHSFILGEHSENGINYKFKFSHRKYYIIEQKDGEEEKVLAQINNMNKAYEEWNAIKRPEKMKKK